MKQSWMSLSGEISYTLSEVSHSLNPSIIQCYLHDCDITEVFGKHFGVLDYD